ncbi:MAG: alpha/beta hydrolase [Limnochordaceae bacterium]|nr:alpha/beta hydrolase [Limnochordaceae bacterium]
MRKRPLFAVCRLKLAVKDLSRVLVLGVGLVALTLSIALVGIDAFAAAGSAALPATAEPPMTPARANLRIIRDLTYATVNGKALLLDLYLPPEPAGPLPLIVWVHGGAWRSGSKENPRLALEMVYRGYAVASINYRLSQEAVFPAQIQDVKAAIRWLRANSSTYGLDPERIGAWGSSAGGHLVALLGTSGGVDLFDQGGGNYDQSSRVQAVVDFYGPTDFLQINSMMEAGSLRDRPSAAYSALSLLLGGPIRDNLDKAAAASPITYITPDDPPFLIVHGKQDRTVPYQQSVIFYDALRRAGVEATLVILPEAQHGGPAFSDPQLLEQIADFFDRHLQQAQP